MKDNLQSFLQTEGLNISKFGEWLKDQEAPIEEIEREIGHTVIPNSLSILTKFVEGVKGQEEGKLIMEEIVAGNGEIIDAGNLLITVETKHGQVRIPKPMIKISKGVKGAD